MDTQKREKAMQILHRVCGGHRIEPDVILSRARPREVVAARRAVAIELEREQYTADEIADVLQRERTTILYLLGKVKGAGERQRLAYYKRRKVKKPQRQAHESRAISETSEETQWLDQQGVEQPDAYEVKAVKRCVKLAQEYSDSPWQDSLISGVVLVCVRFMGFSIASTAEGIGRTARFVVGKYEHERGQFAKDADFERHVRGLLIDLQEAKAA